MKLIWSVYVAGYENGHLRGFWNMQGKLESGVQTFSRKERGQEKVLKSNLDLGFSKFSEEESKWNPTSGCLYCRLAAFSVAIMLCEHYGNIL